MKICMISINYAYLLSCLKTHNASSCRTKRPRHPISICSDNISMASRSSLIGPNQTNHKFRMVRFVDSTIWPVSLVLTWIKGRGRLVKSFKTHVTNLDGGCCHDVTDGSSKPERGLKRGSRCRGQGITRNNWGEEYRKLSICGMNNRSNVLLKCPRMPTMANTIPAK